MKTAVLVARIFAGIVFVFSGFVKAVDPSGFGIKMEEYFMAFHMEFLMATALPLSILFSAAEMMIGLNLLAGLRKKFTAWLLLIFMTYFTVLTFILALTNPVTDCGCFGDALKLTNWQTFWKNIVLFVPTAIIFLYRKKPDSFSTPIREWILAWVNFCIPVMISVYCLLHEPLLDFRPYTTGTVIPEKMVLPEGTPVDQYETILIYEKEGIKKEFTDTNFPWQDTTWKWVETEQKLIFKGEEPPIHDFSITNAEGEDITGQVLSDSNYVLLIVAPKLDKASVKGMQKMNELAMKAANLGYTAYCLTSSTYDVIENFRKNFAPIFELCTTDETTLKTILRSNPGLLIIREGTILFKGSFRDAPQVNELQSNLISYLLDQQRREKERSVVFLLVLVVVLFYSMVIITKQHSGSHSKDTP